MAERHNSSETAVFASRLLLAAFVAAGSTGAHARDYGQYSNVPNHLRNWFKSLYNRRTGVHCCNDTDCARTEARTVDGKWQAKAPDGSSWIAVPPESVVVDQGNPTGEPILCGVPDEGSGGAELCFVPGPDG